MIRRPPRSTLSSSSAASDVYKRQVHGMTENQTKIDQETKQEPEKITNEEILRQVEHLTNDELQQRIRIFESNIRAMKQEQTKYNSDIKKVTGKIKENKDKIKMNIQLPWLVSNVLEILDVDPEDDEDLQDFGGAQDADLKVKGQCVVIKTTTRQTIFLPMIGMLEANEMKPGELVGVNKDSYLVYSKLPSEYDNRVKAMELDEKPTDEYTDIGGLDKQIEELREAIVLPITHQHLFENIGIRPPKGCLLHGPPGTGKTMLARACAAQTNATFLKLAGPQLVQMFIGDGAKLVRDAFQLAKEKAPTIIFIDELDAIGTKRFDSDKSGDREVQRTMLELLNQLDGFSPDDRIKVIAATNRPDILDPALLRSGRLDRKIEFPQPNEEARSQILMIHSRKMTVAKNDVNFQELARSTDEFNGAMLKAVCVEAGMAALRRNAKCLIHEDFVDGIIQVQAKKKSNLNYYA
eukprot:TRINITY_DN1438_c0_g1_i1.p1 TRINITY_DN1438_c0_g1~~TRINITY_DN1438_c0_g1_i1.p1  ORF type:complete len:465 (+),score=95.88 TRINITY_DN1438_c0_g1_i1:127-1521(+)